MGAGAIGALVGAGAAHAQVEGDRYDGRPIARIEFRGLERVDETLALNQVRSAPGQPFDRGVVREDLERLERLGEFRELSLVLEEGANRSVVVVFQVVEAPLVRDVQVTGNRNLSDQELAEVLAETAILISGVPIDDYRIGQAIRAIKREYQSKGYYQVQVDLDQSQIDVDGSVIFVIREGPKIRITDLRFERVATVGFEGTQRVPDSRLRPQLETKIHSIFRKGVLDDESLDRDAARIVETYRDEGFLDARASYEVQPSPNGREAIVTFLIDEGAQYTLRSFRVLSETGTAADNAAGLTVFTPEQLTALFELKPGDVYKQRIAEDATQTVRDAYRRQGYVDARVARRERRADGSPEVDVELFVGEGQRYRMGVPRIQGNDLTKANVIRRDLEVQPGRWLDGAALDESEKTLVRSRLFDPQGVSITLLPEDPAYPGYRDILVKVKETNTGTVSFGAAVNSDAGLTGGINLNQRNFDVTDTPDSLSEFLRGEAFRGAGQRFGLVLNPGTQVSTYSASLSDPRFLDTRYGLGGSVYYTERIYSDYDEERIGGAMSLSRAFGSRWNGALSFRVGTVELDDIDSDAPVDIYEVEDRNLLTSIGVGLARTTLDDRFRPTRGARTEFAVDQVGAMGGDFTFTRLRAEHRFFIPLREDVLGRTTVLSLEGRAGWIPQSDEAPVYERFYLGGSSFRGFEFRGIGPVGVRNDTGELGDDQIGADWMVFFGIQLEQPIIGENISLVAFVDSGTLSDDPGFEDYRVSAGLGLRLYVPQLSPAPIAIDFGFPLVEEDTDEDRLLTFSIDLPF